MKTTNSAIAGATKKRISSRLRAEAESGPRLRAPPPAAGAASRVVREAAPACGEVAASACGPTGAVTSSATSSPGAGSGLDRVHDVLRAGLAGGHKGDRGVHRPADVLPAAGVEVQRRGP